MQRSSVLFSPGALAAAATCHGRQDVERFPGWLLTGIYGLPMAADEAAIRDRFSRFVARALDDARARGLTDQEIRELTGVGISTFYRWRRIGWGKERPKLEQVEAFCDGLGIPRSVALAALGTQPRGQTEPEPTIDPDIRVILRVLADPNVPEADKAYIRETIRRLSRSPFGRTG